MSVALVDPGQAQVMEIPIRKIKLSGGTQPRETIDETVVADYAEAMLNDVKFPPIDVFFDGTNYWPSDGFHRIKAAVKARSDTVLALVRDGTQRDAKFASFAANIAHGLRRSNRDKRYAVSQILRDDEWTFMTDAAIAKHCQVSASFVGTIRKELGIYGPTVRVGNRNGKASAVNTSRGGRKSVLESPDFSTEEPQQKTNPTTFDAFLESIRKRGIEAKTAVKTEFGSIDIETPDAVYIIAGNMTLGIFFAAFATLLFQRRKRSEKGVEKRAVIVGTSSEELRHWIREARRFGVDFTEFKA